MFPKADVIGVESFYEFLQGTLTRERASSSPAV